MQFFLRNLVVFLTLLLTVHQGVSQEDKRAALEKRRKNLQSEISHLNNLLSTNKEKKQSVLTQAEDLNNRIQATERLVKTNNQSANLLTDRINKNQGKISSLEKELKKLKADYGKMIRKSYKSSSKNNRLMFLLSSKSFQQAYKRLKYLKQYTDYRKKQGEKIKDQTRKLEDLNAKLANQRDEKKQLLKENKKTEEKLKQDKKEQDQLIAEIKQKEGKYRQKIENKQQKISKIDAEIKKLVNKAIAAENKKEGSESSSSFKMTPETEELAKSFQANKGKLPWPVKSGNIAIHFGKQRSPVVESVSINSNGIRIETNKSEPAYAVFDGKVLDIQAIRGANKVVLIRHGNYISIYNNLKKIDVKKGEKISTGDKVGEVGRSTTTDRPTLSFAISKNNQYLDPEKWILKR